MDDLPFRLGDHCRYPPQKMTKTVFNILPNVGAGELVLGTSRATSQSTLKRLGFTLSKTRDNMDYYDDNSIQLDYFNDDVLHYIGFAHSPNFEVVYNHVDPFDTDAAKLFELINVNETTAIPYNDYDPLFPTQIISLWNAQEQYDYNGEHQRPVFATFSIGDQHYLNDILKITNGG